MNHWKTLLIGFLFINATGCTVAPTPTTQIPESSNNTQQPTPQNPNQDTRPETYTVQKGDTVFSIMRETGVYWKNIIDMNDLKAPDYIITPDQVLILKDAVLHRDVAAQH